MAIEKQSVEELIADTAMTNGYDTYREQKTESVKHWSLASIDCAVEAAHDSLGVPYNEELEYDEEKVREIIEKSGL